MKTIKNKVPKIGIIPDFYFFLRINYLQIISLVNKQENDVIGFLFLFHRIAFWLMEKETGEKIHPNCSTDCCPEKVIK